MISEEEILRHLDERWVTAGELSSRFGCSEKTVRTKLNSLSGKLDPDAAEILSVRGRGYCLIIKNRKQYLDQIRKYHQIRHNLPTDTYGRELYLLDHLLQAGDYIKRETFAEELYVSEKTISSDMRAVEETLSSYDLSIERKPGYGMAVIGNEFSVRQCLLNCVITELDLKDEHVKTILDRMIENVIHENDVSVPDYLKQSLIDYLALAIKRIRSGHLVIDSETEKWPRNVGIYVISQYLMDTIVNEGLIEGYTSSEAFYVSLYLWGNKFLDEVTGEYRNYVIPRHIQMITREMVLVLINRFSFEDSRSEDLYEHLLILVLTSEIRTKYRIHVNCPVLSEMKCRYPASYFVASKIIQILESTLSKRVQEDEIGFFSMVLQAYLPLRENLLNAAFVCDPARAEDQMLYYQFQKKFGSEFIHLKMMTKEDLVDAALEKLDLLVAVSRRSFCLDIPTVCLDYSNIMGDFSASEAEIEQTVRKAELKSVKKHLHCEIDERKIQKYLDEPISLGNFRFGLARIKKSEIIVERKNDIFIILNKNKPVSQWIYNYVSIKQGE